MSVIETYRQSQIDWQQCPKRIISADGDDLPPNIKAIRSESGKLDREALLRAFEFVAAGAQVVQVENVISFDQVEASYDLAGQDFSVDKSAFRQGIESSYSLSQALAKEFYDSAARTNLNLDFSHKKLIQSIARMANLLAAFQSEFGVGEDDFTLFTRQKPMAEKLTLHQDNRPQYGTNIILTIGKDSTIFVNSRQYKCADFVLCDLDRIRFFTPIPTLWCGKPGSVQLFTSRSHFNGGAFHCTPVPFDGESVGVPRRAVIWELAGVEFAPPRVK